MSPGRPLRGKEAQPRPEFGGNGSKSDLPSYMPNVGPSYTRVFNCFQVFFVVRQLFSLVFSLGLCRGIVHIHSDV